MKTLVKMVALLAMVSLVSFALAKPGGGAGGGKKAAQDTGRASEVKGTVAKVEDGKITVTVTKKGVDTDVVVTTSDKTIVVVPKVRDAAVKDVTTGMTIDAKIADGVAVWIDAKTPKPGRAGRKGVAGDAVPPAAPAPAPAAAAPAAGI